MNEPNGAGAVATPAANGTVARIAVPFRNWTVPVGTPAPGATAVTVAVSEPEVDVSVVVVEAFVIARVPLTNVNV